MINVLTVLLQLIATGNLWTPDEQHFLPGRDTALIRKTTDFSITGKGEHAAWDKASWLQFIKIDSGGSTYKSKSKMLYSEKGIYVLFTGEDNVITTKEYKDGDEIYEGDVFEFFFQTDQEKPPYFEYEINQLGRQLILILSGTTNKNLAWSPWGHEYKKKPLIQKKIAIGQRTEKNGVTRNVSGVVKPGTAISAWTAEIFVPYEVFGLLPGIPPKSGTVWSANFCRIDYDNGKASEWTWSKKIKHSFHELENFGAILFE